MTIANAGFAFDAIDPHGLAGWDRVPATPGEPNVELLLIDMQNDFCHPSGALYVGGRSGRGAVEDVHRVARFILGNVDRISRITPTLDTHVPGQIFFPDFWETAAGEAPPPFTVVTQEDVRSGRLRPSSKAMALENGADGVQWVAQWVESYVDRLATGGKHDLVLWPYHTILGSPGHALAAPILEAAMRHSAIRQVPMTPILKGLDPCTESYSVFGPEVSTNTLDSALTDDWVPSDLLAERLVSQVDAVIVAGEASSHCVMASVDDLLEEIDRSREEGNPSPAVYVMTDCMSPVVTPGMDFTDVADAAFRRWEDRGVHLVNSTMPMGEWPGMGRLGSPPRSSVG